MRWQRSLYWFLAPSLILLTVVMAYPLGYAIYISFFDYHLPSPPARFVGFENYGRLLADERVWHSLITTLVIAWSAVTLEFVLGLGLALALFYSVRGVRTFTVLNFLPHVITPVVAALLLRWIFVGRWGLLDSTLAAVDIFPPDWLGNAYWARFSVIMADSWKFTPFMMLVLYAGLQSIDKTLFEAAAMDGATGWALLWHIILPSLRPVILFVVVIRLMDAIRFFDTIYVLTGGGPGTATETITIYTYVLAFRLLEVGRASALGVLTLLLIASMVAVVIMFLYRHEKGRF
jgi:multiple sugar transport system permease protein